MAKHFHIHLHTRDDAKWDESEHPRKANGEFGNGPALGHNSGRPSGKPYRPDALQRVKRALAVIPPGDVPTERVFSHPEADPMSVMAAEEGKKGASTEQTEVVDLRDLVPTQEHVTRKGLLSYVSNRGPDEAKPISVFAVGSKLYLLDGHHRVAAMLLAGIQRAPLNVMRKK